MLMAHIVVKEAHRSRWHTPQQPPSLLSRILSFLRAFARHAWDGFPAVNPIVKRRRMAICRACPSFNPNRQSCKKCGCALKLKTAWALESCPLSKW